MTTKILLSETDRNNLKEIKKINKRFNKFRTEKEYQSFSQIVSTSIQYYLEDLINDSEYDELLDMESGDQDQIELFQKYN